MTEIDGCREEAYNALFFDRFNTETVSLDGDDYYDTRLTMECPLNGSLIDNTDGSDLIKFLSNWDDHSSVQRRFGYVIYNIVQEELTRVYGIHQVDNVMYGICLDFDRDCVCCEQSDCICENISRFTRETLREKNNRAKARKAMSISHAMRASIRGKKQQEPQKRQGVQNH